MNGKGSARRPQDLKKYRANYDAIDWSPRKKAASPLHVASPFMRLKPRGARSALLRG